MANLKKYKMFINGEWQDSENGKTFKSINPSLGEPWAIIPEASKNDVDKAVTSAYEAFTNGEWSSITPTQRGKYLRKLGEILAEKFN